MGPLIKDNDVVFFQGDSIADCHRIREDIYNLVHPSVKGHCLIARSWLEVVKAL